MTENLSQNESKPRLGIKSPLLLLLISLIIMLAFDQVIWEKQLGMQFLLLTVLVLVGLLILSIVEKQQVPWQSYLLFVPILLGAGMTVIRKEASTTTANILLTLYSLILLALSLLNGQWPLYRIREVLLGFLLLVPSTLIDPIRMLVEKKKSRFNMPNEEHHPTWVKIKPYLIGTLIALPLLLLLGALLASADMIFKARLGDLFNWLKIENFGEFIFRAIYVLILAYILVGAYVHALARSADKKALRPDKPFFTPFLGHTEAFTVLTLVNVLFLGFIIIQFRYFFAGQANISLEGYTYAEYARRGFFELVAVALISLGLYYLLSMFTKRVGPKEKRVFSALGLLIILQVGIMLVSAFQRLSLYEAAYGFTTLRTITHVFMIWLGVLLGAAVLMEIFNQFRRLALVLFLIFFGFTLTLNLLNVDAFIAKRNIEHAIAGNPLDASYLVWQLSDDGIPNLFTYRQAKETPQEVKDTLQGVLACQFAVRSKQVDRDFWAEWHPSVSRADAHFAAHQQRLSAYPFIERVETSFYQKDGQEIEDSYTSYFILANGEEVWCMTEEID